MSNVIKNLNYDIRGRIGDEKYNPGAVLRVMNELYHILNRELKCVIEKVSLPAGTFSDTVLSYAIPARFTKLFNVIPGETNSYTLVYIPQERWNSNQYYCQDVFTILNGEIVFGNVSETSSFDLFFYSIGKDLVDAENTEIGDGKTYDDDSYTNTPEWPLDFYRLLVYETAMEISADYPLRKQDAMRAEEMRTNLRKARVNPQGVTPIIIGGLGSFQMRKDPDYVDRMWVTRRP